MANLQDTIKDPEALKESNALKVSDELREFVTNLHKEIGEQNTDRATWDARQDIWLKKRYGIRSPKSFPWPGSANFVLPQIDSDINRLKPAYVSLVFGVSPSVGFEPFGPEDVEAARKKEWLFDWRLKNEVKFFKPYCLGIDFALSRGFTVFETGWKFETRKYAKYLDLAEIPQQILEVFYMPEVDDATLFHILAEEIQCDLDFQENVDEIQNVIQEFRQGETKFEMTFIELSENRPEVNALDPRYEVYFPTWVTDLQDSPYIDRPFMSSINTILQKMQDKRYEKYDESIVRGWSKTTDFGNTDKSIRAVRDGVTQQQKRDGDVLLHRVCGWFDVDGDDILEKVIMVYPDADPSSILSFMEVPYDHGQFPYVAVRRELNDAPIISSRGIPSLDDDFQTGISTLFNQDIDAGTIATTPTVVAKKNSVKNLKNLRYVPGLIVETEGGANDYTIAQQPNMGQQHRFASMQYLKAWANDRIGNITAAISQSNNQPGNGQQGQKTAKEVTAIESSSSQLQSMDLLVWQMQMVDVYYQIDSLYNQFGSEEDYVSIMNEPPQKVTRKETQGRFNISPNGKLDNSNPGLRAQKAFAMLQIYRGDPDVNQQELKQWHIGEVDNRMSKRLLIPAEQKQQGAMIAKQQQEQTMARSIQLQLGLKRASNMLDVEKEMHLARIKGIGNVHKV